MSIRVNTIYEKMKLAKSEEADKPGEGGQESKKGAEFFSNGAWFERMAMIVRKTVEYQRSSVGKCWRSREGT